MITHNSENAYLWTFMVIGKTRNGSSRKNDERDRSIEQNLFSSKTLFINEMLDAVVLKRVMKLWGIIFKKSECEKYNDHSADMISFIFFARNPKDFRGNLKKTKERNYVKLRWGIVLSLFWVGNDDRIQQRTRQ